MNTRRSVIYYRDISFLDEDKEKAAKDKANRARSADVGISRKVTDTDKKPSSAAREPVKKGKLEVPKMKRGGGKKVQMTSSAKDLKTSETIAANEDDAWEMQQMIDQIDEYYYSLRILPGQDPAHVWIGWVTPQFHYHGQQFEGRDVRKVRYIEKEDKGALFEKYVIAFV